MDFEKFDERLKILRGKDVGEEFDELNNDFKDLCGEVDVKKELIPYDSKVKISQWYSNNLDVVSSCKSEISKLRAQSQSKVSRKNLVEKTKSIMMEENPRRFRTLAEEISFNTNIDVHEVISALKQKNSRYRTPETKKPRQTYQKQTRQGVEHFQNEYRSEFLSYLDFRFRKERTEANVVEEAELIEFYKKEIDQVKRMKRKLSTTTPKRKERITRRRTNDNDDDLHDMYNRLTSTLKKKNRKKRVRTSGLELEVSLDGDDNEVIIDNELKYDDHERRRRKGPERIEKVEGLPKIDQIPSIPHSGDIESDDDEEEEEGEEESLGEISLHEDDFILPGEENKVPRKEISLTIPETLRGKVVLGKDSRFVTKKEKKEEDDEMEEEEGNLPLSQIAVSNMEYNERLDYVRRQEMQKLMGLLEDEESKKELHGLLSVGDIQRKRKPEAQEQVDISKKKKMEQEQVEEEEEQPMGIEMNDSVDQIIKQVMSGHHHVDEEEEEQQQQIEDEFVKMKEGERLKFSERRFSNPNIEEEKDIPMPSQQQQRQPQELGYEIDEDEEEFDDDFVKKVMETNISQMNNMIDEEYTKAKRMDEPFMLQSHGYQKEEADPEEEGEEEDDDDDDDEEEEIDDGKLYDDDDDDEEYVHSYQKKKKTSKRRISSPQRKKKKKSVPKKMKKKKKKVVRKKQQQMKKKKVTEEEVERSRREAQRRIQEQLKKKRQEELEKEIEEEVKQKNLQKLKKKQKVLLDRHIRNTLAKENIVSILNDIIDKDELKTRDSIDDFKIQKALKDTPRDDQYYQMNLLLNISEDERKIKEELEKERKKKEVEKARRKARVRAKKGKRKYEMIVNRDEMVKKEKEKEKWKKRDMKIREFREKMMLRQKEEEKNQVLQFNQISREVEKKQLIELHQQQHQQEQAKKKAKKKKVKKKRKKYAKNTSIPVQILVSTGQKKPNPKKKKKKNTSILKKSFSDDKPTKVKKRVQFDLSRNEAQSPPENYYAGSPYNHNDDIDDDDDGEDFDHSSRRDMMMMMEEEEDDDVPQPRSFNIKPVSALDIGHEEEDEGSSEPVQEQDSNLIYQPDIQALVSPNKSSGAGGGGYHEYM